MKATHAMKTNFKNTYGQKLNTIRKDNVRQEGCLASKHYSPQKETRENTNAVRPTEKRRMLTKTTMASLDAAKHTEHKEGAEHRQKAEQNRLPLKPAVWVFHHQHGVQVEVLHLGERFPGQKEGW